LAKRVNIIGAGPAGLFAAYELAGDFNVTIFEEKGYVGGSGLHSDGKLNYHPEIGGNLTDFLFPQDARMLIYEIQEIFTRCGAPLSTFDVHSHYMLESRASRAGIKYIPIHQEHIGSDHLPEVMKHFQELLLSKGVKIELNTRKDYLSLGNTDHLIVAPGRAGNEWLVRQLAPLGIKVHHNPIDVGVRVEVPNSVMQDIIDIAWDPKFHIYSDTYDDFMRTFCTCPSGFVVREKYEDGIFGVNGHSMRKKLSNNTNFAFLSRVNLTEPLENTYEYGKKIAQLANTLGGKKPIIQRLRDLRHNRRSRWDRIDKSYVSPTLRDATPGDISMAYPRRIVQNILDGLDKLSGVIPGINSNSTILYAPEIKFYSMRIETDKNLKIEDHPIYVCGDGAGVSRGIVGAAATGIIAARGIKNETTL